MDTTNAVVGNAVRPFLDELYEQLLESSLNYFFSTGRIRRLTAAATASGVLRFVDSGTREVRFDWVGWRHSLLLQHTLSEHEYRLLRSIGTVRSARYELVSSQSWSMRSTQLFRGVPEDRYVSAFVDPAPHSVGMVAASHPDRLTDAIEVLRTSSMTTYENRRIATGV